MVNHDEENRIHISRAQPYHAGFRGIVINRQTLASRWRIHHNNHSLGLTVGERGSAVNLPQNEEYPNDNSNWPVLSGLNCDAGADSLEECVENANNSNSCASGN